LGPGTSKLGCLNDRLAAMKKLAKEVEARFIREEINAKNKNKNPDAKKL
jgi:hypothetical protein